MDNTNIFLIFGYIGSGLSCIMNFPQVYLTITEKKVNDLSIDTISMNLLTHFLFLPYSVYFKLYPLLAANVTIGVCDIIIISVYVKTKYLQQITKEKHSFENTENID